MAAPDFTLPDQSGADWALSEHRDGAVVLVFYRGDWWPYCNGQLVSLAAAHERLTRAGARVAGVVVDAPEQNAAMVEKLGLPFPILSDPGGEGATKPYGVWDEDANRYARPAVVVVGADGEEAFRTVGRDFADRPVEDDVVAAVERLGLDGVDPEPPRPGDPTPGERAFPREAMVPYYRGAGFAARAIAGRVPEASEEAKQLAATVKRYGEVAQRLTG